VKKIRQYFQTITNLPDDDWEKFSSKLVRQENPKKTVLLEAGKTENYLSFIEKGLIRMYVPGDTYDTTFAFAFENAFLSGYESFLSRTPSAYRVETLTPTIL
jgi:signal-transduction protein with cAMP-binding, CBS, and nucleotidyltransferase domain